MSHIFLPVIIKPSKYICSLDILTICWLFYYDFFLIRGKMQIGIFSFPSAKKNLGAWTLCLFFSTLFIHRSVNKSCFSQLVVHETEIFLYTSVSLRSDSVHFHAASSGYQSSYFLSRATSPSRSHLVPCRDFAKLYWETFCNTTLLLWKKK